MPGSNGHVCTAAGINRKRLRFADRYSFIIVSLYDYSTQQQKKGYYDYEITKWLRRSCKALRQQETPLRRPLMNRLGIDCTPHSCRHTCISMLADAHVDQTIIKKIVGHSGAMTLTERVYTHLDVQELVQAINLI